MRPAAGSGPRTARSAPATWYSEKKAWAAVAEAGVAVLVAGAGAGPGAPAEAGPQDGGANMKVAAIHVTGPRTDTFDLGSTDGHKASGPKESRGA